MRDLIQVQYCDVCWLEDDGADPVDATQSWTIGIVAGDRGRPVPKVLDLCDAHSGPIADLARLMGGIHQIADDPQYQVKKAVGRPRKDPNAPMREHPTKPCPVCKETVVNNVMVAHIWKQHRDNPKPPIPTTCPECGMAADSSQAMATHRRIAHGYDAVADALSGVKGFAKPVRMGKAPKAIQAQQPELVAEAG